MAKLDFHGLSNPAAISRLRVAPSVLLTGKATSVKLNNDITLTTADPWLEVYCSEGTLEFQQPGKDTPHGPLYDSRISGFHPGADASRNTLFNMMLHYRWAAQITDALGITLQVGGNGEWLDAEFAFGIPGNMEGERGTGILFQGTFTAPAAVV